MDIQIHENAQCDGKQGYATFAEAHGIMQRMMRRRWRNSRRRKSNVILKCRFCGNFHLGGRWFKNEG